MNRSNSFIQLISILLCFVVGCWVKEGDDVEKVPTQPRPRTRTQLGYNQKKCFEQFRDLCLKKQWSKAYQMLSKRWRQHKTLQEFQKNMEEVGIVHLQGARVIQVVQILHNKRNKWAVTAENKDKNKTMYLIAYEEGSWKIDGVKNID